jgi:hypothetical protein
MRVGASPTIRFDLLHMSCSRPHDLIARLGTMKKYCASERSWRVWLTASATKVERHHVSLGVSHLYICCRRSIAQGSQLYNSGTGGIRETNCNRTSTWESPICGTIPPQHYAIELQWYTNSPACIRLFCEYQLFITSGQARYSY